MVKKKSKKDVWEGPNRKLMLEVAKQMNEHLETPIKVVAVSSEALWENIKIESDSIYKEDEFENIVVDGETHTLHGFFEENNLEYGGGNEPYKEPDKEPAEEVKEEAVEEPKETVEKPAAKKAVKKKAPKKETETNKQVVKKENKTYSRVQAALDSIEKTTKNKTTKKEMEDLAQDLYAEKNNITKERKTTSNVVGFMLDALVHFEILILENKMYKKR